MAERGQCDGGSIANWAKVAAAAKVVIAIKPHAFGAFIVPMTACGCSIRSKARGSRRSSITATTNSRAGACGLKECVDVLIGQSVFVHVKDNLTTDGKTEFALPGDGATDYPAYLKLLRDSGTRGPVVVEVHAQVSGKPAITRWWPRSIVTKNSARHLSRPEPAYGVNPRASFRRVLNLASNWSRFGNVGRFFGQDGGEGVAQVMGFHFRRVLPLIVDCPHVGNHAMTIQHEHLGCSGRPVLAAEVLRDVLQNTDMVTADHASPLLHLFEAIRIMTADRDGDEFHTPICKVGRQFLEPRFIRFHNRATIRVEHDDDGFRLGPRVLRLKSLPSTPRKPSQAGAESPMLNCRLNFPAAWLNEPMMNNNTAPTNHRFRVETTIRCPIVMAFCSSEDRRLRCPQHGVQRLLLSAR